MPLFQRRILDWKIRGEVLRLGSRTLLVGAVNLDPAASAAEGGCGSHEVAVQRALALEQQGAALIEFSAYWWRAGAQLPGEAEELRRLIPVLKRVRGALSAPFGVETVRREVAAKAAEYGATFLRDPSGLVLDPALAKVAAQHDLGLVVGHWRGSPETWTRQPNLPDPAGTALRELEAAIGRAKTSHVDPARIAIDPGFGMGKRKEANTEILRSLNRFHDLGLPIVAGPFGQAFGAAEPLEPSLATGLAAAVMAVRGGAHLLRAPQTAELRDATLLVDEVVRQMFLPEPPTRPAPRPRSRVFGERPPAKPIHPKLKP